LSNWLAYDELVDLVRNYHHDGFTGLITGVSDNQHSFHIGFRSGQIVSLSYRILKGSAALEKMIQIDRAKVTELPNTQVPTSNADLPETSVILSRLTLEENQEITDTMIQDRIVASTDVKQPAATKSSAPQMTLDDSQIKTIKSAAVHHFGPIGAMVCEEFLSDAYLSNYDLDTLLRRIAEEVGANNSDTRAFLNSVS